MSGILECLPQPEHSIAAEWHGSASRHPAEDPSSAEASHNGSCHREHVKFSSAMDSHSVVASTPNKPEGTQGFWLWQLLPSSASDGSQDHESVSVQQNDVTPQQTKLSDSETAVNLTGACSKCDDLRKGDILHKIDGKHVDGMTRFEVASLILGPEGSFVHLTFLRQDSSPIYKLMEHEQDENITHGYQISLSPSLKQDNIVSHRMRRVAPRHSKSVSPQKKQLICHADI
ncbi:hypothetical protein GUITHDRAFT_115243 [Guillardia theta CCMP2712]|uniref:Uncharacterized protein n=1 Tax=Guillardia theta (strain CCMP2712) TaxID=905079 RepID=L1IS93_GUITC|nr:hypothetical protein GUITHDRAFT_115243 [Guillardia theta CCMP2712]EKX38695.1 hypothetical protein GUITHDRAFT_115243 [Guillardia theta CCMP2712]|eukprot:XP_005825675.1 hypothetical protein GUITHDRAFT_115243 [Guillardia theta CCMP2712]